MTDFHFLGLQEGCQKGEEDAKAGRFPVPLATVGLNILEPGYLKGYDEGYRLAYKVTRENMNERETFLREERLRQHLQELDQDLDPNLSRLENTRSMDQDFGEL